MKIQIIFGIFFYLSLASCTPDEISVKAESPAPVDTCIEGKTTSGKVCKVGSLGCKDPDLSTLASYATLTLCNGDLVAGTLDLSSL